MLPRKVLKCEFALILAENISKINPVIMAICRKYHE